MASFRYVVDGRPVCREAFLYAMALGEEQYKNLMKHFSFPRDHGNRGGKPQNALSYPVVKACVRFIQNNADEFGIPRPAPLRG